MLKLTEDKVAIQPVFDPDKIGSIYVPDQAKSRCKQGIVKYVGPEVETVKPGDYVFFPGYTGTIFRIEDEGLLIIMKEPSLVAIIESNEWQAIEIPGLFFRSKIRDEAHPLGHQFDGSYSNEGYEYFQATYEQAMHLITRAITDSGKLLNVKDSGLAESAVEAKRV